MAVCMPSISSLRVSKVRIALVRLLKIIEDFEFSVSFSMREFKAPPYYLLVSRVWVTRNGHQTECYSIGGYCENDFII